jgi:hypothetical protein
MWQFFANRLNDCLIGAVRDRLVGVVVRGSHYPFSRSTRTLGQIARSAQIATQKVALLPGVAVVAMVIGSVCSGRLMITISTSLNRVDGRNFPSPAPSDADMKLSLDPAPVMPVSARCR